MTNLNKRGPGWLISIVGLLLSLAFLIHLALATPSGRLKSLNKQELMETVKGAQDLDELKQYSQWKLSLLATTLNISDFLLKATFLFAVCNTLLWSIAVWRSHRPNSGHQRDRTKHGPLESAS